MALSHRVGSAVARAERGNQRAHSSMRRGMEMKSLVWPRLLFGGRRGDCLEPPRDVDERLFDTHAFEARGANEPDCIGVLIDVCGVRRRADGSAMAEEEDVTMIFVSPEKHGVSL